MIITKAGPAAADVSARRRRDAGAAAARRHGAGAVGGGAARRPTPVRRLGFVYIPMGANIAEWTPKQEGAHHRAVADPAAR